MVSLAILIPLFTNPSWLLLIYISTMELTVHLHLVLVVLFAALSHVMLQLLIHSLCYLRILRRLLSRHSLILHHGYPSFLILYRSFYSLPTICIYHRTRILQYHSTNPNCFIQYTVALDLQVDTSIISPRHFIPEPSSILKILIEDRREAHAERVNNNKNTFELAVGDIVTGR